MSPLLFCVEGVEEVANYLTVTIEDLRSYMPEVHHTHGVSGQKFGIHGRLVTAARVCLRENVGNLEAPRAKIFLISKTLEKNLERESYSNLRKD